MRIGTLALPSLLLGGTVRGGLDLGYGNDSDLTQFFSRPEIKAPKVNVIVHDKESVTPGYFFLGPYIRIQPQLWPQDYYQPCQTGPHIYDNNGELVWSGACQVQNSNTFDFKVFTRNGEVFLSMIVQPTNKGEKGNAVIMDSSYRPVTYVRTIPVSFGFNIHEFLAVDEGQSAVFITSQSRYVDLAELGVEYGAGWVLDSGFVEVDIGTGDVLAEWWAYENGVDLTESSAKLEDFEGPHPRAWNFLHANSVDKCGGDYLYSMRFTDSIMKISGIDGEILWRLGGTNSSFALQGFNFSRQHDARWLECNEDREVISFLDNAADNLGGNATANESSALLVELDKTTMTARVRQRWSRPDHRRTTRRGSFQILDQGRGNAIAGWSDDLYVTEHKLDGTLVMEMRGASKRSTSYRLYKFNFTGSPIDPPDVVGVAHGTTVAQTVTLCYVSWNGATEVTLWKFYRKDPSSGEPVLIGRKPKTGFETKFVVNGYEPEIRAEALAADGTVLGTSLWSQVAAPSEWDESWDDLSENPSLQDESDSHKHDEL